MKKKIIVDTDMGWDDVLSLCYLIKHPQVEIVGVSVTGCGETNLRWGTIIAQQVLGIGGLKNVPVVAGTETPTSFDHVFPQDFRNDMNGVMGLLGTLNPAEYPEVLPAKAWEFLYEQLSGEGDGISLLSLGGFTNLAKTLQLAQGQPLRRLQDIVAMAGAVYVDGNIQSLNDAKPEWNQGPYYANNWAAEWNVFVDPGAARQVFQSELPLMLVPLDACNQVLLTPDFYKQITAKDPVATLARQILDVKSGAHAESSSPVPIFDPLATMALVGDFKAYQTGLEYMEVIQEQTEKDSQCGRTAVVPCGSRKIKFMQGVSAHAFSEHFADVLNLKLD